jgi:hypothetical protein
MEKNEVKEESVICDECGKEPIITGRSEHEYTEDEIKAIKDGYGCTGSGFLWEAKDGKSYCDYCYDYVFYPREYGFTRTDLHEGRAGYDEEGKPIHQIH